MLPSVDSIRGFAHAADFAAARRCLRFLVDVFFRFNAVSNEETRLEAFEMKGLRKILRVSWTAKKTNKWVLNKAGVKRELLDTVKGRKLLLWSHHEEACKGIAWGKK